MNVGFVRRIKLGQDQRPNAVIINSIISFNILLFENNVLVKNKFFFG